MNKPSHLDQPLELDAEQVRTLLDALPFYAMLIDEDHEVLLINRRVEEEFGERARQLIGSYCPRSLHGCDQPYSGCPLEKARETGFGVAETEIEDAERGRWFLSSIYPVSFKSPSGKRLFLHFTRDITARKRAEQARKQSLEHSRALKELLEALQPCDSEEAILSTVLDHLFSLSWVGLASQGAGFVRQGDTLQMVASRNLTDEQTATCSMVELGSCLCGRAAAQGLPVFCSRVDERHERHTVGIGDHGHAVLALCDRDQVFGVLNLYLPAGHALDADHRGFLAAVASAAGGALRRQRMQNELAQTQFRQMQTEKLAALGTLVAGVAHEVNNPLAGLKNCQKWLTRDNLSPERRKEYLELMADGLQRIQQVMEQLLSFGRLRTPRWSRSSLLKLVTSTCALLEPTIRARHVSLEAPKPGTPDARVRVDAGQVQQALTNLLLNALYVTPAGGVIRLRLLRFPGFAGFEIEDQGPGIPEEIRTKIENPFFTTKPEGKGTGLGLSVTRTIVDAHHGKLTFRFPAQGGTIATLLIPGDSPDVTPSPEDDQPATADAPGSP